MNQEIVPASSWLEEQRQQLYSCVDWRQFVEIYWSYKKKQPTKLNYAELSRRAKYTSRGYLYEMLKGRKKISAPVVPRLVEALKLRGSEKQFFVLLTRKETDEDSYRRKIETDLKRLQLKVHSESEIRVAGHLVSKVFSGYHAFTVYAALGRPQAGASFEELLKKTNLSHQTLNQVLNKFISIDCVYVENHRYFLRNESLDLAGLGSEVNFKETYLMAVDELKARAKKMETLQNDLFFHTAISIRKGNRAELKEKLKECILEFVESHDEIDGDDIIHINLSAFKS